MQSVLGGGSEVFVGGGSIFVGGGSIFVGGGSVRAVKLSEFLVAILIGFFGAGFRRFLTDELLIYTGLVAPAG